MVSLFEHFFVPTLSVWPTYQKKKGPKTWNPGHIKWNPEPQYDQVELRTWHLPGETQDQGPKNFQVRPRTMDPFFY